MNVLKNFEAVFVAAVGVAACTAYLAQSADGGADAAAKRMSTIEKQPALEDGPRLAKSGAGAGNRS